MKTFDDEYDALWEWFDEKTDEYIRAGEEALRNGTMHGRDSQIDKDYQNVVREYNRRLAELKDKYNMT